MKLYSILKPIFKIVPKRIGHSLNVVITNTIINLIRDKNEEIWVRNSIALNYDNFGSSDIDLTLTTANFKNSKTYKNYLLAKKFVPLLQEINVYPSSGFSNFYTHFNQCELRRDPLLLNKFNLKRESTAYEEIVFLLKMCESNDYKSIREKKWKYYNSLTRVNKESSLSFNLFESYTESISDLNSHFPKSYNLEESIKSFSDKSIIIFQTNKWIVDIIAKGLSIEQSLDLFFFSTDEKKFIEAFLWWEAQGILTQQDIENDKLIIKEYMSYLNKVANYFEFKKLIEFFNQMQKNLNHM